MALLRFAFCVAMAEIGREGATLPGVQSRQKGEEENVEGKQEAAGAGRRS